MGAAGASGGPAGSYYIQTLTGDTTANISVNLGGFIKAFTGGYYAVWRNNSSSGNTIVKFDLEGNIIWATLENVKSTPYAIDVDTTGNVVVAGQAAGSSGIAFYNKVDGNAGGRSDNGKTIQPVGSASNQAAGIACDGTSVGLYSFTPKGGSDTNVASINKYDDTANPLTSFTLRGSGFQIELTGQMAFDSSSNMYLTAYGRRSGIPTSSIFLLKLNSTGDTVWGRAYTVPDPVAGSHINQYFTNTANTLHIDSSSNLYSISYAQVTPNYVIVKKNDSSANLQYSKTLFYANANTNVNGGITTDASGNAYVLMRGLASNFASVIVKLDSSGNIVFGRALTFGSSSSVNPGTIDIDENGNIVIGGVLDSGVKSGFVACLPPDGSLIGTYPDGNGGTWTYADAPIDTSKADSTPVNVSTTKGSASNDLNRTSRRTPYTPEINIIEL